MAAQQELFSVGSEHVWQRRFYDFNVWTARKRIEKLRYMHRNPVVRGLAQEPEQWPWSSYWSYALGEEGAVRIDQCGEAKMKIATPAA
jgi:putative transposase